MIKLALLIPTLDRSGAEKQFTLLATHLPRDEFDVRAIALTRGGPYEADLRAAGIPLTILNKRMKFDPVTLWRLRRLLADLKPDILHTWLFAANAYGRLVAGKAPRPRVVVSERCVDSWKAGWHTRLDRRQIARTTRLVANSQSVADFYAARGYAREQIEVIPNAVVLETGTGNTERDAILAEFEIPAGARVVGYVGRLARQKRVHDLIWAFQLLRQVTERVYFLLVGNGPERNRLVRLAQHMGCDHLVRFAGHRQDVPQLMSTFNVVWLASDFEGMSNSLMEAMARGVPVVASDIPPNRELVLDGQTGYLVKVGDSAGFCQFTDRILNDEALSHRLGEAGRERMRTEFSLERMVEAHAALYRRVCLLAPAGAESSSLGLQPEGSASVRQGERR